MEVALSTETVTKIYKRWAPVYDLVFGSVFDPGRHAAIAASERIGGRILDVGVGTGIALPHYAKSARVVGVDLSEAMLHRARERVAAQRLHNIEGLAIMDAGLPRRLVRRHRGAIRHQHGSAPGGDAR